MSAEVRVSGRNVVNGAGEVIAKCTWGRDAQRIAAALNNEARLVEALLFVERGLIEGSIKAKPYVDFDPNATSLEPKSVLSLVQEALAAAGVES